MHPRKRKIAHRLFLAYNYIARSICDRVLDVEQVGGLEQFGGDRLTRLATDPLLILGNHESWLDIISAFPLREEIRAQAEGDLELMVTGVSRKDYVKVPVPVLSRPLSFVLNAFMEWTEFFVGVNRISMNGSLSDKEEQRQRLENAQSTVKLQRAFGHSVVACAPVGTTKTTGHITPNMVRNLGYTLREVEVGGAKKPVEIVPFGNTYDWMSGDDGKILAFFHFGKSYRYTSIMDPAGDSATEDKKDRENFKRVTAEKFLTYNTLTTSQLLGSYITDVALAHGAAPISYETLESVLQKRVDYIVGQNALLVKGGEQPILIDTTLLNRAGLQKRAAAFYHSLVEEGYIEELDDEMLLDPDTILREPESPETYKKQNILRYMVNRVVSVGEHVKQVGEVLKVGLER